MWVYEKPVDICILMNETLFELPMARISVICSYVMLLKCEISLTEMQISTICGLIIAPHSDQFPVGLIIQLVEHCTGVTKVRLQVLFRYEFFRP